MHGLRLTWVINGYFEGKINNACLKPGHKIFELNTLYTRHVINDFWLQYCPIGLLLSRVHDWVETNDRQIYVADYFITSCEWSSLLVDIRKSSVYKEAVQINNSQLSYQQTDVYQKYVKKLSKGKDIVRNKSKLDSLDKLEQYFMRYKALFNSIREHGLLSLKEAKRKECGLNQKSSVRRWQASWVETEIGVAIGPNGEIAMLPGAKHRLSIAMVLGIQSAKVQVRMVHINWLLNIKRPTHQSWSDAIKVALEEKDQQFLKAINQ